MRSASPLESALLVECGDREYFVITVVEVPTEQTPPPEKTGSPLSSVVLSGGKLYHVKVRGLHEPSRAQRKKHRNNPFVGDELASALVSENNAHVFTDDDGDFDYIKAGWPVDVWQLAFGKVMAPIQMNPQPRN